MEFCLRPRIRSNYSSVLEFGLFVAGGRNRLTLPARFGTTNLCRGMRDWSDPKCRTTSPKGAYVRRRFFAKPRITSSTRISWSRTAINMESWFVHIAGCRITSTWLPYRFTRTRLRKRFAERIRPTRGCSIGSMSCRGISGRIATSPARSVKNTSGAPCVTWNGIRFGQVWFQAPRIMSGRALLSIRSASRIR